MTLQWGSYDAAEICELVHKLEDIIPQKHLEIYRDDGLAVLQGSGPQLESTKKIAIFNTMNLSVNRNKLICKLGYIIIRTEIIL